MKINLKFIAPSIFITTLTGYSQAATIAHCGEDFKFNKLKLEEAALNGVYEIKWQQMFQKRSANYIQIPALGSTSYAAFTFYVEAAKLGDLFAASQCSDSGICTIPANNESFQYGQNNEKTLRFFVYHNTEYKIFQHRFLTTTTLGNFTKQADEIKNLAMDSGITDFVPYGQAATAAFEKASEMGKAYIGDYLHRCDG